MRVGEWLVETDEALLEVVDPQAGLLNHPRIPGGQAKGVASERDAGGAYHRWNEVQVGLRVQQAQLGQVLREQLDLALVCKGATKVLLYAKYQLSGRVYTSSFSVYLHPSKT